MYSCWDFGRYFFRMGYELGGILDGWAVNLKHDYEQYLVHDER